MPSRKTLKQVIIFISSKSYVGNFFKEFILLHFNLNYIFINFVVDNVGITIYTIAR